VPTDLLTDITRQIEARKHELAGAVREYRQLEAAAAALVDGSENTTGSLPRRPERTGGRARSQRRRRGRRRRAARGANRDAVLTALGQRAGLSVRELADATGVKAAVLYPLCGRLLKEGVLVDQPGGDGRRRFAVAL
jgi:transposase